MLKFKAHRVPASYSALCHYCATNMALNTTILHTEVSYLRAYWG